MTTLYTPASTRLMQLQEACVATDCYYPEGFGKRISIRYEGLSRQGSRQVWRYAHGDPGKLWVLHTCTNGMNGCIALCHLYLGSAKQNVEDAINDGTRKRIPRSVLTEGDVRTIKQLLTDGESRRSIAAHYNVTRGTIDHIARGLTWSHIT